MPGFEDARDYPLLATDNQVVVGIFGGSVASFLSVFEAQHQVIRERLERVPRFRGKEIVVLNFAVNGYKQPQQMLTLSYFMMLGQRFDVVIDISGFNEVAFANLNRRAGVSLAMPNVKLMMPLAELASSRLSVEQMGLAYASVVHSREAMLAHTRAESCPSALCNVVLKAYATRSWRSYLDETARFEAASAAPEKAPRTSFLHIDGLGHSPDEKERAFREMASIWSESARLMNSLCMDRGIAFFQVLQPNQYHPTKRVFTAEEQRDAIAVEGRYREGVEAGYPLLAARLEELGSRGLRVLDARDVFDAEPVTVYRDNCCHFNDHGQELVARRIGERLAQSLTNDPAPGSNAEAGAR